VQLHADLRDGGELRIIVNESLIRDHFTGPKNERLRAVFMQVDAPDHRITPFSALLTLYFKGPSHLNEDACMALKAQALGLEVQDYRNDRIEVSVFCCVLRSVTYCSPKPQNPFSMEEGIDVTIYYINNLNSKILWKKGSLQSR
jgi:hypothetical protein